MTDDMIFPFVDGKKRSLEIHIEEYSGTLSRITTAQKLEFSLRTLMRMRIRLRTRLMLIVIIGGPGSGLSWFGSLLSFIKAN